MEKLNDIDNAALKRRFTNFQTTLQKSEFSAALISNPVNFEYFLGVKTESDSQLLIPAADCSAKPAIITGPLEEEMIRKLIPWPDFDFIIVRKTPPPRVINAIIQKQTHKIIFEQKDCVVPNITFEEIYNSNFQNELKKLKEQQPPENLDFPGWKASDAIQKAIENGKAIKSEWEGQIILSPRMDYYEYIAEIVQGWKIKALGLEFSNITYDRYLTLQKHLKKIEYASILTKDITQVLQKQRLHKDIDEINRIRKACAIGDMGLTRGLKTVHEFATEMDVVAEIEYAMKKAGADQPSFPTIVVSGYKSAWPHGHPGDKAIQKGDLVTIDLGAQAKGYCSDMTRTVIAGKIGNEKTTKILQMVNQAFRIGLENVKVNNRWGDPDLAVRKYYQTMDQLKFYNHSLGHGVGVEVHEQPWIAYSQIQPDQILEANMVFTIEPGLYVPDVGGARTEDTIWLKNDGYESLCRSPI
jgi:Xaa-Pro aminopeptidase